MANQLPYNASMKESKSNKAPLPKVTYLDRDGLPSTVQLSLKTKEYDWLCYPNTKAEDIIERSAGATVLVINKVPVSRATLEACPSIKHIAVSATGYNVVDLQACKDHGVSVSNTPSYATTTVPEHVMMLSLCLRRQMLTYRQLVLNGEWANSDTFCLFDTPIEDLNAATFGVLGFGELGRATAKLAHAMGMRVIAHSRSQAQSDFATHVSFEDLLAQSDILSIHTSLNPDTSNIISHEELKAMKQSAVLINTARGGVVDEQAAADAIKSGAIAGLGFDVLTQEPPVNGNPLLEIAEQPNVIISPHNAWASVSAAQTLGDILMSNIHGFLDGDPQNLVI